MTGASATGGFIPESPAGWSDNLSPNLGGGEELGGATKKATEGATEECSWRGRPWPRIQVILELIFSKNTLPNGLANLLGMEKLEL